MNFEDFPEFCNSRDIVILDTSSFLSGYKGQVCAKLGYFHDAISQYSALHITPGVLDELLDIPNCENLDFRFSADEKPVYEKKVETLAEQFQHNGRVLEQIQITQYYSEDLLINLRHALSITDLEIITTAIEHAKSHKSVGVCSNDRALRNIGDNVSTHLNLGIVYDCFPRNLPRSVFHQYRFSHSHAQK